MAKMSKKHSATRVLAIFLSALMLFTMLPLNMFSAIELNNDYGTLSAITSGGSVTNANDENAVVTYADGAVLEWSPADTNIGRNADGWWVGVLMTAPANMLEKADFVNADGTDLVTYKTQTADGWSGAKSFWNAQDSNKSATETQRFIQLWGLVNEEYLNDALLNGNGDTLDFSWCFDWNGDGEYEQTASLKVDPENIVLNKNSVQVYPAVDSVGTVQSLTDGLKIDDTSKNYVKVTSEDVELIWIEKGDVRPDDGWWAGIKVNAPENLVTEADFANVTYQRKVGDGWSDPTSFWDMKDSADDAQSHNITLWGLLNKEYLSSFSEQGRNLNYVWRFDWNGDGVYEQIVHLEILPETVVLNDENGNQVYPNLATVTPITGGNVTGETSELTLLLEEANINWVPANEIRSAGWWVGMRVNAPEGYSEETLKKATYDRLIAGHESATEDISFWSAKDSKDGDSQHYIEMWINLNAALIEKYEGLNKNIENSYTFDWDGDGENDQVINFNIAPSDKIILNKVEQTGFGFVDSAPTVWVGTKEFTAEATGGQSSNDVVYSIEGDAATINADTGVVTLNKVGTVVVTATKPGDDVYNDITASYTLTITKKEQTGFAINQPSAVDFEEGKTFENTATGGQSEKDVVYEIVASESLEGEKLGVDKVATIDKTTGTLTLLRSGKVTVRALKGSDDKYYEAFDEYTLTINRGTQEVVFEKGTSVAPITCGNSFANVANALSEDITYTTSDKTIAKVNSDGSLSTKIAGTVTITATAAQNEKYNSASASYTITINKAEQIITFEKGTKTKDGYEVETTYNVSDNHFANPAKSNKNITDCVYSVSYGSSYIENFDSATGEFDIVKAGGPVVISVTFAGTPRYNSKTESYALTINKAEQEITFPENSYNVVTGEDFVAPVATDAVYGEGEITYAVTSDDNGVIKDIDAATGEIELTYKAGTAVITATKATDTNYKETTAQYTLVVSEWLPSEKNFTVVDSNGNEVNSAGWFNNDVSIVAKDGYEVATVQTNGNADWSDKLTDIASAEKADNIVTLYVKDLATGYISKAYTETIKIDKTVPTGAITVENNVWDKVLEIITFGLWTNEKVDFTITADDTLSGVAKVEYYVVDENASVALDKTALDNVSAENWTEYKGSAVTVSEESTFVIYAKITDNADNYYYVSSDGLVYDVTAPSVEIELPESVNGYYSDDFYVSVKVEEENNSYSGIKDVSYEVFNGDARTQSDLLYPADDKGTDDKAYEASEAFKVDSYLNNSDNVKIVVTATDKAGNKTIVTQEVKISAEPPSISIDFEELDAITEDDVNYYGEARTAIITIKGRNSAFAAENVKLNVTAVDKNEKAVENAYSYDVNSWSLNEEGNYFAKVVFNGSAKYSFSVDYTDRAGLTATQASVDDFVVDTIAPTGTITVSELGVWDELIDTLTFGLWSNKSVDIKVTPDDTVSPIKSVEYYKTDAKTAMTTTELGTVTAWEEYKDISITEDEVFTVYAKITDNSGNVEYISTNGAVVDSTKPIVTITPDNANENGIYNGDVKVNIDVMESANYSGLNKVEYWVVNNGTETHRETLYSFDVKNPKYEELEDGFNKDVVVKSADNNSCNVELFVGVTDNAGNYSEESVKLDIDVTAPTIEVSYDNNDDYKVVGDHGYFDNTRTATVVFTERTEHFDEAKATEGIIITATDAKRVTINPEVVITWSHSENAVNPDLDKHIATIEFAEDANYTFSVSYTDKADNANKPMNAGDSVAPYSFTVDTTLPTGEIEVENYGLWDDLLEILTFGLWSNETVDVKATYSDVTADIESVEYYMTDAKTIKTAAELDEITEWKEYSDFSVPADEIFAVYVKITDNSGNVRYLSTDGVVVDATAPEITIIPDEPNENDIYNGDVNIKIDVEDPGEYSGLKSVKYWIIKDGVSTEPENLYEFNIANPKYEDLEPTFNTAKVVNALENNSCYVEVFVGVTDNAGNYSESSVELDIDVTAPTIEVSYDNNDDYKVVGDHGYFDNTRTATVVFTERTKHFDEVAATKCILITATDVNGKVFDPEVKITWDHFPSDENPDMDKHIATIQYLTDANYEFSVSYTDKADNDNKPVKTGASVTPYSFTVDTLKPEGTVTVGELGTWDKLVEFLTFGLWSKDTVEVTETHKDATAGVESVHYYKTSATTALKESDLKALAEENWTVFEPFEVNPNETFTVYVRIIDNSGNVEYISTNGIIVDDVKPEFLPAIEDVKPEIILAPVEDDVNGLYDSDVNIAVSVEDPIIDESYSGLKEIRYEIYNLGVKTQEGTLYSFDSDFDSDEPTQDMLLQAWNSEAFNSYIKVESELNNSNDVVVKVFALDNSGNENEDEIALQIDITKPTIDVTYDNNNGDTTFEESTYFDADRMATIVITERNFNADNVKITVANTDKVFPVASEWTTVNGTGNGDDTTHTATILYNADGDYTFDIYYVDEATNSNEEVNYGDSLAPTAFTIDKTAPLVTVEYDNNEALNGNYYKAQRIATITVTEHNFETGRIRMLLEATDDGVSSALPTVSKWTTVGDVHTATITYSADSLYTFDFDYQDKAGNATADIAQQSFYVDKTNPAVSITKIVDQSANNSEGDIGFVITATDTNFDKFAPVLTVTDIKGNSTKLNLGSMADIKNGKVFTVKNIASDGIYRITCTVVDKAGNEYSQVTLQKADGSTYAANRSGNDTLVTFSVNRDGSTYEIGENTADLVGKYYVQNVTNDVVIVETNADPLKEYKVILNGKELVEGTDYTVAESGGNGSWMKYTYTVNKAIFADEGEYKLVVSSKDKAENDAFSDIKNATVNFVVDRTAPIVTVTGMATDGEYVTDSQTVTITPTDDGGALKSIIVRFVDEDGKAIKEIINLAGEELEKALEEGEGKLTFTIDEGLHQNVQIVCNDCAVDENGETNICNETYTNISVSLSEIELFWADPVKRWVTIGCVALLTSIIISIIVKKKKKDNKEEK